jgi:hypothetical protein
MSSFGSIIPPGPLVVADGATPSFLITPGQGLGLVDATVDGTSVTVTDNHDGTYTYIFLPVHGNHALVVTVAPNE